MKVSRVSKPAHICKATALITAWPGPALEGWWQGHHELGDSPTLLRPEMKDGTSVTRSCLTRRGATCLVVCNYHGCRMNATSVCGAGPIQIGNACWFGDQVNSNVFCQLCQRDLWVAKGEQRVLEI